MVQRRYKEFEIVVMAAGKGSRISELTGRKPKCLLPIMNLPMVYFPLKMFENLGYEDVFLVVLEMDKIVVESALEKTDLRIQLNIITIPGDKDWGTADTLRYMHSYFTHTVIVASCDLVTDININEVLQLYREEDSTITCLYFHPKRISDIISPGRASKTALEKDIVAFVPGTNQMAFVGCSSEFNETVQISNGLLKYYKHVRFHSDLQDSHLYIIKKSILNFLILDSNKDKNTLKGEVIPYIVKKQSSKYNRCVKSENVLKTDNNVMVTSDTSTGIISEANTLVELCKQTEYNTAAYLMSSYNTNVDDLRKTNCLNPVKCYAYIADVDKTVIRANNMYDYCMINKQVSSNWQKLPGMSDACNISLSAEINSTTVDKATCFIGAETQICQNNFIKTTNIGARCVINPNCRITNSIIMDEVIIEERCILDNCVVCDNAYINAGSNLKNCIVGSHHKVPSNSTCNKDILSELDELMEI